MVKRNTLVPVSDKGTENAGKITPKVNIWKQAAREQRIARWGRRYD